MNYQEELLILRAIYNRSHAQRQTTASLDEVASDLAVHPTRLRDTCRPLQNQGWVIMPARFLQLTPIGRRMVESA